ncbi:Hypothetical protein CAP_5880 [Chondromyces apiculatus DSM 436]|uniref:Uncharacterized protein n=1 Tax=Chondromyces apiculatus DSM 436 TaxID=1192034 RepID=A0A017TH27_9BACT|nr:Hypothetical protein CAP_5880 [Chondromyces apiculatus DSM 436]
MTEILGAASAAREVGDESPSQFSRDDRRLCGAPPHGSASQLRRALRHPAPDPPSGVGDSR